MLDALEGPLRSIVELGYDRTDYSKPAGAQLFPTFKRAGGVAERAGNADADVPAEQSDASQPAAGLRSPFPKRPVAQKPGAEKSDTKKQDPKKQDSEKQDAA